MGPHVSRAAAVFATAATEQVILLSQLEALCGAASKGFGGSCDRNDSKSNAYIGKKKI